MSRMEPAPRPGALWLVLSYLGPLAVWPLLRADPDDRTLLWHARHGLVLFVIELVGGGFYLGLAALGSYAFGPLALAFAFIGVGLCLFVLVLHGLLVAAALAGDGLILPCVTRLVERL